MSRLRTVVAGVMVLGTVVTLAQIEIGSAAAPTTYSFSGTLVSATDTAALQALGLGLGDPFSVSFNVDPALAVDFNATENTGAFSFPSSPLTANIAGSTFSSTGLFVIVGNDAPSVPPVDFVSVGTEGPFTAVPAPYEIIGLNIGLTSSDLTTITNDDFFIPLDVSPFDENRSFSVSLRNSVTGAGAIIWGLISNDTPSPEDQINALMQDISELSLDFGTTTSLNAKLGAAVQALARGNEDATCAMLQALIYDTQALVGKKLTSAQANQIIGAAVALRSSLGCS